MDRNWEAEKYSLSKMTISFLSKRMPVKDAVGGEIGYTNPADGIFVAKKHKIFDMLDEDKKRFFRKGVFAHELLHQIFTDFDYTQKVFNTLKPFERPIFSLLANVLEDPAIEYWAKTKFGGSLLRSLKFSIAHIYDQSPSIDISEDAFSQFVSALIQLGDMGLIKGSFSFPEAKETFLRVAPLFNAGVLEPNPKRRLEIAKDIMEISRPLWEEMAKKGEAEKTANSILKSAGKKAMSGSGGGEEANPDKMTEGDSKSSRRSATIKKITKASKVKGDDKKGDDSKSASVEDVNAETESTDDSKGDKSDDCASSKKKSSDSAMSEIDEDSESEAETSDALNGEENDESESAKDKSDAEHSSYEDTDSDDDAAFDDESLLEDRELSHEDALEIASDIEKAAEEIKRENAEDSRDDTALMSMNLKGDKFVVPSYQILNQRASSSADNAGIYESLVGEMSTGIRNTTKQIQKMITFAQEETEYATRGKLNIKRLNCGKVTPRVFDRKRVPSDVADLIIGVVVDLSGSMSGDRIANARKCCIAIAEICNKLGVPVYIMGYTGDCWGYRVVHEHFVTWKNSKNDRLSLLHIDAQCENYDGPSIRYFSEIMRKKQARHKLMIVISDGRPSANNYRGTGANNDTAMAIREAHKVCDVLGVAIGNSDTALLHSFYGGDFLHVSKPSDLFAGISVKLKKFVRKWIENDF